MHQVRVHAAQPLRLQVGDKTADWSWKGLRGAGKGGGDDGISGEGRGGGRGAGVEVGEGLGLARGTELVKRSEEMGRQRGRGKAGEGGEGGWRGEIRRNGRRFM